jgi:hypothetical protein
MSEDKSVEFSLMGLVGLLAEHGLRVVAWEEKAEKNYELIQRAGASRLGTAEVFKVKQITLTVTLEIPEEADVK